MDNKKVFTGLGMLLVPLLIFLVYLLIKSQIDWGNILESMMIIAGVVLGIAYVILAFTMIIKGAFEDD